MNDNVERFDILGIEVAIHPDAYPPNPRRDYTNLGIMLCAHRRYDLGDGTGCTEPYRDALDRAPSLAVFARWLRIFHGATVVLPLYLYDHSGLAMRAGRDWQDIDPGGWDSGLVGVIFDTAATREETGVEPERVRDGLLAEVAEYDSYLRGDVYGYVATDPTGTVAEECCWGIIGYDQAHGEAVTVAEYMATQRDEWLATGWPTPPITEGATP